MCKYCKINHHVFVNGQLVDHEFDDKFPCVVDHVLVWTQASHEWASSFSASLAYVSSQLCYVLSCLLLLALC
jgi:hypothetical protein